MQIFLFLETAYEKCKRKNHQHEEYRLKNRMRSDVIFERFGACQPDKDYRIKHHRGPQRCKHNDAQRHFFQPVDQKLEQNNCEKKVKDRGDDRHHNIKNSWFKYLIRHRPFAFFEIGRFGTVKEDLNQNEKYLAGNRNDNDFAGLVDALGDVDKQ